MKYTIELRIAGLAKDVTEKRDDLFYICGEMEINNVCDHIGWNQLGEDQPTAMWIQIEGGDYGDIFCVFASISSSRYNTVYQVIRKMESVYDQVVNNMPVPVRASLQDLLGLVDDARKDLHNLCQDTNLTNLPVSQMLADFYRDLTAVADNIYAVAYPTKERD